MRKIKIILKKNVENLGFQYDELYVKAGYARNYLIPKGLAITASVSALKNNQEIIQQRSKKESSLIQKSIEIEKKLKGLTIQIPVQSSREGKLFGSISNQDIKKFLNTKGIDIDKKFIRISGNQSIKSIGKYQAILRLHRKKELTLNFEIINKHDS